MYDRIYVSALDSTPEQQALNDRLVELLESYSFDIFFPRTKGVAINGSFDDLAQPLDFSKMMVVIFHQPELSPQMEYEVKQAVRRHIPMLALSNVAVAQVPGEYIEQFVKVIPIPDDHDELLHPLMTTINRHFPV